MISEKEIKKLVVARLETIPSNLKISVGDEGDFTPEELIEHVKKGDKIGKAIVEIELEFLRALKDGLKV